MDAVARYEFGAGEVFVCTSAASMRERACRRQRSATAKRGYVNGGSADRRTGRPEIVDFGGLGGPGRPGNLPKRWGASPPTFLEGFPAARGRPDLQNRRFPVGRSSGRPNPRFTYPRFAVAEPTCKKFGKLHRDTLAVTCTRCGAYSFSRLGKLGAVCCGRPAAGPGRKLCQLLRGRHPSTGTYIGSPVRLTGLESIFQVLLGG